MKPKILMASYGGGHVNVIIPLYNELIIRGYQPVILGLTTAAAKLRDEGIAFYSYSDFITDEDREAIELGEKLTADMELSRQIPKQESIAYMGICYQELIQQHGTAEADRLFRSFGRQCFLPKLFMRRVLEALTPDIVVTTSSPRSEKALVLQAGEMGIKCFCIVDFYQEYDLVGGLGERGYADKVFVPFREMKKLLQKMGRVSTEIEVCGNPALDYLATIDIEKDSALVRQQRGWQDKFVVFWVKSDSAVLKESEKNVEEKLVNVFDQDPAVQIVIRPHPNDPGDYSCSTEKGIFVSTQDDPVHLELATCDVLVTMNSTVGLQANLLGKPVIQVDVIAYKAKVPFSVLEIGVSVKSLDEMIDKINDLYAGLSPEKILPPVFHVGKSSSKIVDNIECDFQKLN